MKALSVCLAAALACFALDASATVESGHIYLEASNPEEGLGTHLLTIDQRPTGGYTGAFFNDLGNELEGGGILLNGGVDLFVAPTTGLGFSDVGIASGLFQPFLVVHGDDDPVGFTKAAVPADQDFYVAVRGFSDLDDELRVYGWARLTHTAQGLAIADSAVAFNEKGIVIGAVQAVPEPSAWALSFAGLAAVAWGRKRTAGAAAASRA